MEQMGMIVVSLRGVNFGFYCLHFIFFTTKNIQIMIKQYTELQEKRMKVARKPKKKPWGF